MRLQPVKILIFIMLTVLCAGLLASVTGVAARSPKVEHKVFVAFGFHVNLYHSFRNDTNDEYGYGKDIRVIRHIIKTLDQYNAQGVPVKGVWDFDNLFSLQERLPRHAPDIIRDIQRRVAGGDDEVILMSYNNGLASAMTHRELTDAMQWAVSNPWGSGVKDLFGNYSPIVRPQEMMTTPGNFSIYKAQGIEAVSLYYSATPFDAFRVFSRKLNHTEAFNPITYRHPQTREEITVIPTYHIGDLMEHVSLRNWAAELHRLQKRGQIDNDVLIYINYDADSEYWSGLDLDWPLDRLPNTGGLAGLIKEVKGLDYVEFTTLQDYLDTHPPVGTFSIGQDTADGSFDGYNSWAEKAQSHAYWTRIEYHRRFDRMVKRVLNMVDNPAISEKVRPLLSELYLKRMRALSTTNFGMATPYLAPEREAVMTALLDTMDDGARKIEKILRSAVRKRSDALLLPDHLPDGSQWIDTLLLTGLTRPASGGSGRFLTVHIPRHKAGHPSISLMNPDGQIWPTTVIHQRMDGDHTGHQLKLYVSPQAPLADGIYYLLGNPTRASEPRLSEATEQRLQNGNVELRFTSDGHVAGLYINGKTKLLPGSLTPYFRHQGALERPDRMKVVPFTHIDGVARVRLDGRWQSPQEGLPSGHVDYQFSVVDGLPYLFIDGRVTYPSTMENDIFKADAPALARRTDWGWHEAAPMELRFAPRTTIDEPVRILKHNFLDISSSYQLDYFRHSPGNLSLDNINNHITSAYFAMVSGGSGMAVAMDTHVSANFAFAPAKVRFDDATSTFAVKANPFGTYHGRQYHHPTWGNRQGYEMALLAGEQFHSAAPTYNGRSLSFSVMLAFFDADEIPAEIKSDLIHYARSPEVISLITSESIHPNPKPMAPPVRFEAFQKDNGVHFRWEHSGRDIDRYRVLWGSQSGTYNRVFTATQRHLFVGDARRSLGMRKGRTYYAVVEALGSGGRTSQRSSEIAIAADNDRYHQQTPRLSLNFKLKVLWANISAYMRRYAT